MVIYQGTQWKITLYKQLQVKVIYFGQNDWPLQVMAYLNTSGVQELGSTYCWWKKSCISWYGKYLPKKPDPSRIE